MTVLQPLIISWEVLFGEWCPSQCWLWETRCAETRCDVVLCLKIRRLLLMTGIFQWFMVWTSCNQWCLNLYRFWLGHIFAVSQLYPSGESWGKNKWGEKMYGNVARPCRSCCCGHGHVQSQVTQLADKTSQKNLGAHQFRECLQDSMADCFVIHRPAYCLPQVTNQMDT